MTGFKKTAVRLLALWIAFSLLHAASLEAKTGINIGDQARDFTLRDANGASRALSAHRGEVVVLYFAMWCTTCRANTLELQREIYLPLKDHGVKVFAVDYLGNKQDEVRSVIKDLGLLYPVLLDDRTLTDQYGEKMSITLVIDRSGVIRYRDFYDLEKVKTAVADAAGVKPPASSPPSGEKKKEQRPACPLPQKAAFHEKQVFYGSAQEEFFGFAVPHGPVDLNKDGLPDAIIGTPSAESGKGAVFIHFGRQGGFSIAPDFVLTGEKTGEKFGASVLVADVNNDGFPDLVAGGAMSRETRGSVSLFLNSEKGLSRKPVLVIEGGAAGDWFGSSLAAGDFNRDGYTDLAIAAFNDAGKGAVHLYYGRREGHSRNADAVIRGSEAHDYFGSSICIGDMNHDGLDDLVVSATGANGKGTDRGAVYVFFANKNGFNGERTARNAGLIFEGDNDLDGFGSALSCEGDLDGDGRRDLVIGASGSSTGEKRAGAVYLFHGPLEKGKVGAHTLHARDRGLTLTHGGSGSMFGSSLAALGDVNGDDIDDFAVGAMNAQQHPERAGAVHVYFGNKERTPPEHEVIPGAHEDGRFGRDISPLGKAGFLVTETGNSERVNKGGAVHLISPGAPAYEETECSVCGMVLSRYRHTRYEVTEKDGRKHATCGVQCGLVMQLRLKEQFLSAQATDFITGRSGDAAEMAYLYKSEAVPDMWPSFIAFRKKSDAEKFRKGFGGTVLDFRQALNKAELIR